VIFWLKACYCWERRFVIGILNCRLKNGAPRGKPRRHPHQPLLRSTGYYYFPVLSKLTVNSVVFLFLTAFTVAVAVVFRNPLLVYTAIFLATSNVVLYVWAQASVRGMRIRRIHSNLAVATRPAEMTLELTNNRRSARYGTLGFDLHAELTPGQDYTPVAFLQAPPGVPVREHYLLTPARRGEFRLGPFYLYGGDPFGFYKCWCKIEEHTPLLVLPNPVPFHFTRPGSTSQLAQDELETVPLSGESNEFMGVREYAEGESMRRVHWRSTARMGKLISRQYEKNVAASISALLLADDRMLTGSGSETPLEYSITMIASLGQATLSERFHFSYLALMGNEHDTLAGTGRRFYQELAIRLAKLKAHGQVDWTRHGKALLTYMPASSSLIVFIAEINEAARQRLRRFAVHFRNLVVVTFDLHSFERAKPVDHPGPRLSFGESYLQFEVQYGDNLSRVLESVLAKPALLRSRR
jgi:uncharacterized protein (DUF58 family)